MRRCPAQSRSFLLGPDGPARAPPGQDLRSGSYMAANRSGTNQDQLKSKCPGFKGNPGAPAQSAGDLPVICLAEPRAPGRWLLGRDAVTSKFGGKLAVIEYGSLPGVTQARGHAGQDPEGGFPNGGWAGSFMAGHWRCNSRLFPHGRRVPAGRRTREYLRCVLAAHWPAVIGATDRIALALEPPAQGRSVHDPLRCHLAPEPAAPPRCPLKTKAVNVLPAC